MMKPADAPFSIAVVGHTNAGKTSLLRTLARDKHFGQVSARPGETRHVESISIVLEGRALIRLFDSPGFEDAIDLQTYLRQFASIESRRSALDSFLRSPEARGRFEQEAKIVRLLLDDIDAVFYVIDTTEAPHAKFKCELDILAMCGRPVMPVLNFVCHPKSRINAWQTVLQDRGLHVHVSFDAVAPLAGSERLLYEHLSVQLGAKRETLKGLVEALAREAEMRRRAGLRTIGTLLVDVAAFRKPVLAQDEAQVLEGIKAMHAQIGQLEQRSIDQLLSLYRFDRNDVDVRNLRALKGRLEDDLFNAEVMKQAAKRLGLGATVGALIGLSVDVAMAGLSLGAGALIGSALGGMAVSSSKHGVRWIRRKFKGQVDLTVDDVTLSVLLARQSDLLAALQGRAHAATGQVVIDTGEDSTQAVRHVMKTLAIVRGHPEWSTLSEDFSEDAPRAQVVDKLVSQLD
jgi:hypothetical protein